VISQFSSYFAAKVTSASVVRVAVLSVLRLIPMGVFGGATFPNIGRAFDLACKELNDAGQPDVVHEVNDQKNHHGRSQR